MYSVYLQSFQVPQHCKATMHGIFFSRQNSKLEGMKWLFYGHILEAKMEEFWMSFGKGVEVDVQDL